ncbi:hypothetical protein HQ585_18460 [candidate division KSB1 bacterium]|nr:hypothetical protein [candidate division KSB1 bacterium]
MMKKLEFLIGQWTLIYDIPESSFSHATTGTGEGTFRRDLDDKAILFDYSSLIDGEKGSAHGIFMWDEKAGIYRYWWFESSGAFTNASCNLIDDETLYMNWHNSLLRQTFQKITDDEIVLHMNSPNADGGYDLILEVIFRRKSSSKKKGRN